MSPLLEPEFDNPTNQKVHKANCGEGICIYTMIWYISFLPISSGVSVFLWCGSPITKESCSTLLLVFALSQHIPGSVWSNLPPLSHPISLTPILHVKTAGTYKYTVYRGDQQTASHLFVVTCIPGIYIHAPSLTFGTYNLFTAQYILGQSDKRSQQILQASPAYDTSKIYFKPVLK